MELKIVLGALAAGLALVSYVPYFRDVLRRRTRPHAASWLVWASLSGVACIIQMRGDGMAGAWTLAMTAVVCSAIATLALVWGETKVDRSDKASLLLAGCALVVWMLVDNVLLAAICITAADTVGGFLPTFRKSYNSPHAETAATYGINALAFVLSIMALGDMSAANIVYPLALVILNAGLAGMLVWRRRGRWQHRLILVAEGRRI